ncbi:hypothetical protein HI113_43665, partial [Corallococcus exiguus]|nr:hypothetical protein [Corallococcus exiguus]
MVTWFDLMRDAQSKAGLETVARQYHISTIEAQRAMAAVMPAFAMGLQHKLAENDPARFFGGVAASPFAAFWQSTMRAFTPQA